MITTPGKEVRIKTGIATVEISVDVIQKTTN